MSNYAVEVNNVTKTFHLPRHKNDSLKAAITQAFKPKEKGADDFHVLNGVSFKIEKGDFFGILGRNGSGKSTLLKIISEIYRPTSGSVKHDGKLVSFIELGVGFKAELSGRENVYLNGGLLGFSKQEVEEMYDDIVSFAELEDFMDQKLKNYSSGMKVRLAFSVAIRAKADILILDEVLAVGDADFQRKCTNYFETLKNNGKTVILVTHSMGNVRKFCNKAVVIEDGKVIHEGDPDEAADKYLRLFAKNTEIKEVVDEKSYSVGVKEIFIEQNEKRVKQLSFFISTTINIVINSEFDHESAVVAIQFADLKSTRAVAAISTKENTHFKLIHGENHLRFKFNNILLEGDYQCNVVVGCRDNDELLYQKSRLIQFSVVDVDKNRFPESGNKIYLASTVEVL